MNRRDFLRISTLASASFVLPSLSATSSLKVVIIGAGIIGSASAYYLAKAGAQVTIIDKEGPASHASRGTFAWLNATWAKQPQSYHAFNQIGLQVWHDVASELSIPIKWNGSIEWFAKTVRNQKLVEQIAEQQRWGEPATMLNSEQIRAMEPQINIEDSVNAAFSGNDGAVDPVFASYRFLERAKEHGAKTLFPCAALKTIKNNDQAIGVETTSGAIAADMILVCAGADEDTITTLSGMSIPQRSTPGVIAVTKPLPPIVNTIVAAPGVHLHQREDGVVVLGEQAGPPEGLAHETRLLGRPNDFPAKVLAIEHGNRILNEAKSFFPALEKAIIDDAYIGWRPLPLDGHPVLGFSDKIDNTYLALSHSGVSLAPLIGKLVTQELLTGKSVAKLSAYRPQRKFTQVIRY